MFGVAIVDCHKVHAIVLHASRCTNNCVFCGSKDFGDIESNVAEELGRLHASVREGQPVDVVEISGNDPAEYPGLSRTVSSIRRLLPTAEIRLASHGKTFTNPQSVQVLIHSGITEFVIPLYGHTSAVHDAVTRTPGSFVRTLRGLTSIAKCNGHISITSLVTRQNQAFLSEMLIFLSTLTQRISLGVPYFGLPSFANSVPEFSVLKKQLSQAIRAVQAQNSCVVNLRSIPRCLLDFEYKHFEDSQDPPVGAYEHWRDPEHLESGFVEIVQDSVLPKYRKLSKTADCTRCIYEAKCPGFLTTYIEHRLFKPEPIAALGSNEKREADIGRV